MQINARKLTVLRYLLILFNPGQKGRRICHSLMRCFTLDSAYRLGLGATPRASIARTCTMNKIRRNINKRIRSTLMHQEGTEMIANGHMAWRPHINKDMSPDEGSRSLAFCSHVSGKTTISDEALKIHKTKRKRRRKGKYSITQDNFVTEESNPAHVLATAEESVNNSCKANDLCTHKPKVRSVSLMSSYSLFTIEMELEIEVWHITTTNKLH